MVTAERRWGPSGGSGSVGADSGDGSVGDGGEAAGDPGCTVVIEPDLGESDVDDEEVHVETAEHTWAGATSSY